MTCSRPGCEDDDTLTVMGDDENFGHFCGLYHLSEWAREAMHDLARQYDKEHGSE